MLINNFTSTVNKNKESMPCLTSYFKTQREYNDRSRHRSKSRSYIETDTESQIGIDTIILALDGYKQPSSGQTQTHCHETDRNIPACNTHTQTSCLRTDTNTLSLDRHIHPLLGQIQTYTYFYFYFYTGFRQTNASTIVWHRHTHPILELTQMFWHGTDTNILIVTDTIILALNRQNRHIHPKL